MPRSTSSSGNCIENRVIVVKFWLSVGKGEQLERFAERDRDPLKRFKVDPEDWANRKLWNPYQAAAREMIARTSTPAGAVGRCAGR